MSHEFEKFDPAKLQRLNDPARLERVSPDVLWQAMGEPTHVTTIVEIGAGTGLYASEFLRRAPDAVLYASDVEAPMVEWMRENRPEVTAGRLVPLSSQEEHVPLEDSSADIVYMLNVHHELAEPSAIYAEAFRLLRPGGQALIADWAPVETSGGPPGRIRVSAQRLADYLTAAGFERPTIHEGAFETHSLVTAIRGTERA